MGVTVPEGYKQTKVGVIPEEWEVLTLKDILSKNIQNGYSPICPEKDTGHWILGLGALSREEKLNIFDRKPAPSNDEKVKQFILEKNDFLISRANTPERVGFSGVFRSSEKTYSYPDLMMRFRVSEELTDIGYIENCLKSFRVLRYLQLSAAGSSSSMVKINKKVVENIKFPLPPLKEQQKIAQIFTTWDEAISKQEALIAEKEQLKKGLMQKLLSGDVRFEGFGEEWEEVRLGDVGMTYGGLTGKKAEDFGIGNAKYVTYKNIFDNSKLDIELFEHVKISSAEQQHKVQYGDILFTTSSETPEEVGMSSVMLDKIDELYLNSFCFGYRVNDFKILNPNFARFYFRSFYMRDKISRLAQGSTRFNLSKLQVMKIKVKLPTQQEQQKIAQLLTTADREIELFKKELEAFKEQKRGLMQKLLTGEVRVKIDGGERL